MRRVFASIPCASTWCSMFNPRPPHLLRYLDRPNQCLGSERIAKRFLGVLTQHGVGATIFKAHSLRGAVATFLLRSGVPKDWVQCRGGWRDVSTMNEYYNRCHLTQNWEAFLLGNKVSIGEYAEGRQTDNSAKQVAKGGSTEASPSKARSEHPEPPCEVLLAVLGTHGILKPLLSPLPPHAMITWLRRPPTNVWGVM